MSDPRPPGGGRLFSFSTLRLLTAVTLLFFHPRFLNRPHSFIAFMPLFIFPTPQMKSSLFNPLARLDVLIEQIWARINNKKMQKPSRVGSDSHGHD